MTFDPIPARALAQGRARPQAIATRTRTPGGAWEVTTWSAYANEIRAVARALAALGVAHGDRVALLAGNRQEWGAFCLGALAAGAVPAGIYQTCSPAEVAYIVSHSESPVVLVDTPEQLAKLQAKRDELAHVRAVVLARGVRSDDPWALTWEGFLARGAEVSADVPDARTAALKPDDLAVLIYTSGTTGPPKGVMLTHKNIAHTASVAVGMIGATRDERLVSYLPLSHIAEQMFSIHGHATAGYELWWAESLDTLLRDLQDAHPTLVFGVPRVWEKMHARLSAALAEATGLKAVLLGWARRASTAAFDVRFSGGEPAGLTALAERLARRVVLSKIHARLGLDQARLGISGAAPIAPEVLAFFVSIGLPIFEVYGQSEGSGPTTFNLPRRTKLGTVGPAIPGCEVRVADDGEIVLRGDNVFAGYFKEPDATAETLVEGWLHSGDLGKFDADGFLSITGRKKDILITAGGKNIAPKNLEAALKNLPLVSQAVVIGDRRRFLSALLTLDPEAAKAFAEARGLPTRALHELPEIRVELQRGIDQEVNPELARVEQIRKFSVLPGDFSVDGGELTPTMKVKRRVVDTKYADVIEAMYADEPA